MIDSEKKYLPAEPIAAWTAFAILLACYWLTVAPTVSFWDCPEYVSAAYLLEVGHPPGNPVWMLAERMVTLFVPPQYAALAVNLSSGLFTAFAAFFLAKTIFRVALWVLLKLPRRHIPAPLAAGGAALTGALIFGLCDSVWYSAVEAEVYAMSLFMTSLCIWLMAKWAGTRNRGESWRLLVLIAYLFGLSIGIHQLNLLCIPALAMIWAVRRGIRSTGKMALIFLFSLIAVGCVLVGMMPSTIALAARFELLAVNTLGLPTLSGVAIYVALLGTSLIIALFAVGHQPRRGLMAAACFPAIFLSGLFIISDHFAVGAVISALAAVLLVSGVNFQARRLYLAIWMLAMLLTGYSAYAIIPIRGHIPSPANNVMPGDPFSFAAYQSREQYGAKPLLYGPTPFSRNLLRERFDSAGRAKYDTYYFDYSDPIYVRAQEGGRLRTCTPGLTPEDTMVNSRILDRMARGRNEGYLIKGRRARPRTTPELDMWFPRITSHRPDHLRSYAEWIGMDTSTMTRVNASEVVDTAGNPQGRLHADGSRRNTVNYRPTYLQNLQWLTAYQSYYMYWRYLLWNFVGRQNDRPGQGEVQHGNFITGFTPLDNAMLGAEDSLPDVAGKKNKGRNVYFALPLLLGVIGIFWLLKSGRRGKQTCALTAILFVMTGLAITVYLNQDPGEARERDYSFLGSYLAFAIWVGFGGIMIARRFRSVYGFAIPLAVAAWLGIENFDDHDRSNRFAARYFAHNILNSVERDAIIFVNGDNYTFPLWYAQEVEGIRTDVRIVNLAYLQTPVYAANQRLAWRDAAPVPTTLTHGDVVWGAFSRVGLNRESVDTLPATEALRRLRESQNQRFACRYVTLPVSRDSLITFDLCNLSQNGGRNVDFGRLMIFDIVATGAASEIPRPVYWLAALGADKRIGLKDVMSPWLFGYRFGLISAQEADSLMAEAVGRFHPLNPPGKPVYMDYAPSTMTSTQRGPLTAAARRLLEHGRTQEGAEALRMADVLLGESADSYMPIIFGDSLFHVRRELVRALAQCADSLRQRAADSTLSRADRAYLQARAIEFEARSRHHHTADTLRTNAWRRYRRSLPPRLRSKMAPIY